MSELRGDQTPGRVTEDNRALHADGIEITGQRFGLFGDTEWSPWLLAIAMAR